MRFLWFHLMPYKDLPVDFKKPHNIIWMEVDPKLFDRVKAREYYN